MTVDPKTVREIDEIGDVADTRAKARCLVAFYSELAGAGLPDHLVAEATAAMFAKMFAVPWAVDTDDDDD